MLKAVKKAGRLAKPRNARRRASLLVQKCVGFAKRCWKAGQKIWSLRGAAIVGALAVLISAVQILVAVHGKLVILPFEVRGDQNAPGELGASFAQSLSTALNEYRLLFPSAKPTDDRQVLTSRNYADLVQSFMSQLPFVEIPRTSPLNKGATVLESIKIGPVSLPISQLIFENLAFFHEDTLRGSLEAWDGGLVARISLGGDEKTINVLASKEEGYRALIARAAVELLQEKKWIDPMPMNRTALSSFSDGLRNYLDFDRSAEERFIKVARERYADALRADGSADLARLHLAAAQYISIDPAMIAKAIENFSLLLGNQHFGRAAGIGYVASALRYINRDGGCDGIYRFLTPVSEVVSSWERSGKPPQDIEELLLWSGMFRLAAGYMTSGQPCAKWVNVVLGEQDVGKVFRKAQDGYQQALTQIAEPKRYSANDVTRYRFYVLLTSKYLLDDQVDYFFRIKKPDPNLATAALQLGQQIQREKDLLPEAQQRFFAPSIAGSVADSYLRLARMAESDPAKTTQLVSAAVEQLRIALRSPEAPTVQWALYRLADVELGRSNASASLEWLIRAFNDVPYFSKAFDESYFPFGILVEKPARRCEAIEVLRKGMAAGSNASGLFLVDVLRRHGDVPGALAVAASLRTSIDSSPKWTGNAIGQKLALVEAKLKPQSLSSLNLAGLWEQLKHENSSKEFLKFDLFELAEMANDERLLTSLKAEILFPLYQSEVDSSHC